MVYTIIGSKGTEQRKVQQAILESSDPEFTKWAIHAILCWRNMEVPPNLTHIHGTGDLLLPYKYVKADYTVEQGEHVMIMEKHNEVSQILKQLIT